MGKGNEHVKRVLKRVEIIKSEISEGETAQEEDVPMDDESQTQQEKLNNNP
jgi:hypothetical protein